MLRSIPASPAFATCLALGAAACGTTASTDDGPLVPVVTATSANGAYAVTLLAHESTLTRGSYTLQYDVTSATDGTPVEGIAMTIVPWMPAMGHGTSITPSVTELGAGSYELDDIDLFMPGLWELRTTTTGTPPDHFAPSLQVD